MPLKKAKGKKGKKGKKEKTASSAKTTMGPPPKPKKIPPPPACFGPEEIIRFKEIFKAYDENNVDVVKLDAIPLMLRKLGFNPKGAEIKEMFRLFLKDEQVETVEFHEWLLMIEAKLNWGDDFESVVTKALAALGHDDEEKGTCDFEKLREELMTRGEPLTEVEFKDWLQLAIKDKTYNPEDGTINYAKFVENMNNKDERYIKEPINYFKLDQKTLAEIAIKKAKEEREEQERKEAEIRAKEEAKRQKMILDGLIPSDELPQELY